MFVILSRFWSQYFLEKLRVVDCFSVFLCFIFNDLVMLVVVMRDIMLGEEIIISCKVFRSLFGCF